MLKTAARSRFVGHVFSRPSSSITAGLLPHLRSASQAQRLNQKRPYSSPSTEPYAAVVDAPGVAVDNAESSRMAQHLNGLFSPLQFPHELAARILTHSSYRDWRVPHNARLSFVGRRVLNSYLLMFLDSSPTLNPKDHHFDLILERTLDTHTLGEFVAPKWNIGRIMRWTPVLSTGIPTTRPDEAPRSVGLYKVQGSTVEAIMGGIYHQFGGAVSHRVFHTRLLPHLLLPGRPEGLHDAFHDEAIKICEAMGGPESDLLNPPLHPLNGERLDSAP